MTFDDFKNRNDAAKLLSYFAVERTGEQVDSILIDFNALQGRPVFNWDKGVLTITFDRSAQGRVQ